MLGREARSRGFNVQLAGGINLARDPRNGRNFEYLSEDPLLSAVLAAESITGIQAEGVISTIKHYSLLPENAPPSAGSTARSPRA
jgi:beta-glucosidase